jgi:hypothetical protein
MVMVAFLKLLHDFENLVVHLSDVFLEVGGLFDSHLICLHAGLNVFFNFSDTVYFLLLEDIHVKHSIAHSAQLALILL